MAVAATERVEKDISHNEQCRLYLANIDNPLSALAEKDSLLSAFAEKLSRKLNSKNALDHTDFTDLYQDFFRLMKSKGVVNNLTIKINNSSGVGHSEAKNLIHAIYHNDNKVLESMSAIIEETADSLSPGSGLGKALQKKYHTAVDLVHKRLQVTPEGAESKRAGLHSVAGQNIDGQAFTRIPTIARNIIGKIIQYSMGTQAIHIDGKCQVNPLYSLWLQVLALEDKKQHMIYINVQARDGSSSLEKQKERERSQQLESLKNENLTLITIPESGLISNSHCNLSAHAKGSTGTEVLKELTQFALHDGNGLYISKEIRENYFKSEQIQNLLRASFCDVLGSDEPIEVTEAQKQAIWMHYTNYYIPKTLIQAFAVKEEIQTVGVNFTCKDAIDRGGRASAIYNLFSSFEEGKTPMTAKEFDHTIHAAALMVKGRGMNDKFLGLWNLIDTYVNTNFSKLTLDPGKRWLIEWRNLNCPKEHAERVLQTYIAPVRKALLAPPQATSLADPAASPASPNPNSTTTTLGAALRNLELRAGIPPKTASIRLSLATHAVEACLHPDSSIDRQKKAMPLLQSLDNAYAQGSCPTWLYKIKQSFSGLFQSLFHTSNQDGAPAAAPNAAPAAAPASKNSYTRTVTAFFEALKPANSDLAVAAVTAS